TKETFKEILENMGFKLIDPYGIERYFCEDTETILPQYLENVPSSLIAYTAEIEGIENKALVVYLDRDNESVEGVLGGAIVDLDVETFNFVGKEKI
ncbi:MAG: hypothetical protein ACRC5T_00505, partial [Cetobacterium sp.]